MVQDPAWNLFFFIILVLIALGAVSFIYRMILTMA